MKPVQLHRENTTSTPSTSSMTGPHGDSGPNAAALRGMTYAQGVAAMSPVQMKDGGAGGKGGVITLRVVTVTPGDDSKESTQRVTYVVMSPPKKGIVNVGDKVRWGHLTGRVSKAYPNGRVRVAFQEIEGLPDARTAQVWTAADQKKEDAAKDQRRKDDEADEAEREDKAQRRRRGTGGEE